MRITAAMVFLMLAGPVQAQRLAVPVDTSCPPDSQAACAGAATVTGLNPQGDGFLAIRTGPGTRYKVIGKLYNGDEVTTYRSHGEWQAVRGRGVTGWVHGRWLDNH